jgi:hypothetical protein
MKKFILPFLAGWALSILISPQNVFGMFRPKA